MLCSITGSNTCHKYFPTSKDEPMEVGGIKIELKEQETDPELNNNFFVQRTFRVTNLD